MNLMQHSQKGNKTLIVKVTSAKSPVRQSRWSRDLPHAEDILTVSGCLERDTNSIFSNDTATHRFFILCRERHDDRIIQGYE